MGAFAFNAGILVPVFAKEILGQKETGFGLLMSLMGIGSFLGAMTMAFMSKAGPKKVILILLLVISGFLVLTGFSGLYALTGLCLAALGFSIVWFSSAANSMVQIFSADQYRGRVMSIYTLAFADTYPHREPLCGCRHQLVWPTDRLRRMRAHHPPFVRCPAVGQENKGLID